MHELIFQTFKPWLIVRFQTTNLTDPQVIERATDELDRRLGVLPFRAMVLINFRGVEFVSSQVIGLLLSARAKVNEKAGTLVLCRVGPKIREALHITGLEKQFTIEESETIVVGEYKKKKTRSALPAEVGWLD